MQIAGFTKLLVLRGYHNREIVPRVAARCSITEVQGGVSTAVVPIWAHREAWGSIVPRTGDTARRIPYPGGQTRYWRPRRRRTRAATLRRKRACAVPRAGRRPSRRTT